MACDADHSWQEVAIGDGSSRSMVSISMAEAEQRKREFPPAD